ncbi:hypothetical protein L0Z32_30010 [Burkholderia multivorans]|uniref:hypothetical protein n=1 Tax=Burkholderia multivorans TaxID=87883 RepID=UPI00201B31A7|nr:hypothetical protein [Burkholderia multivorans]MCL4630613.1 hypothetical protein [Burkholderia multivorans]
MIPHLKTTRTLYHCARTGRPVWRLRTYEIVSGIDSAAAYALVAEWCSAAGDCRHFPAKCPMQPPAGDAWSTPDGG